MINVDVNVKTSYIWKRVYVQNPSACICENGKYFRNIMDDSVITCDEVIVQSYNEEIKTIPTNFNEKKRNL